MSSLRMFTSLTWNKKHCPVKPSFGVRQQKLKVKLTNTDVYYTGKQSRIKGFWATEAHSSCAFFMDYVFYFIIPKILFSGIPAGTEETPVQSGHSGVCEIVTGLFLWAKKSRYKKSSLLQSGRMKNVIETQSYFLWVLHSCFRTPQFSTSYINVSNTIIIVITQVSFRLHLQMGQPYPWS